ncbi:hypothetical protein G6W75_10100 [Staphylococcus sciuri]|uniref:hypothetical protein n=1 Tax=Mammaliicoccus sciuri TaxID=1296 RepID=UPI0013E927BF|nr:hypothetical protein [Mammaliicoccus sciuri]NGX76441.1 hypothetical protein [Mammaliicoccus sciuri]
MSKNENKNKPPSQTGSQEKRTKYSETGQNGHYRGRTSQRPRPTKLQKEQFKTRD